jgi:Region found in RelA / SpoT proteins
MKYAVPEHSKSRVDGAGKALRTQGIQGVDSADLAVINNWRAAHSQPLVTFNMTLRSRSAKVDTDALVAQRLKRLTSIEAKLRDRPNMRLSQMQDIGGVRAVVSSVANVLALATQYRDSRMQHSLSSEDDYIERPKPDGYRGIHLIYRYKSEYERSSAYDGLFVELQVRSRMQHAWATTVETVSTLTGQALKSTLNTRRGEERWRRFLALMSSVIATWEKSPTVPDTPTDHGELVKEVKNLSDDRRA